jgi:Aspartyl protease
MKHLVRLAVICIVVTCPGPIHSQSVDAFMQAHSTYMEVTHGKPYVMVTINGKGPFRFIVDTGTGGDAIITSELATQLDLPQAGEARLNDPTGQGGQNAPIRRISTLRVAGIDFYAIKAVEHTLPIGDGACQGMLGFTLFRDFLLTLDYVNGRMILTQGELTPDGEKSVLPFRMPDGVPIARLKIGGRDVEAQIDSGGAGLSLPEGLIPQLRLAAEPAVFANGVSLSTRFQIKVAKLAGDVQLGDITLDRPWVEINPAFPLANFGSCPLQHFIVTFDQENRLVRLDGPHKHITLGVTPAPLHLNNQPGNPSELALVPVG